MESLKRERPFDSSFSDLEDDARETKRRRSLSLDPLDHLPSQVFVQVLLDAQPYISTTAWVLVRVSRRWKEAIEKHLWKRWKAIDVYHPFLWSDGPSLSGGLIPPMVSLLKEWGRQGWLGLLQWAHGLGFPLLHPDDHDQWGGRHTLLAAACLGGHQPVVAWVLDSLGGHLHERKAIKGACRSGNDALLRWLVEKRHVGPSYSIPHDENPASGGNLEMCQRLVWQCATYEWLTGAGRNDHRHILEWAISGGRDVYYLVWPVLLCLAHCPRTPQAKGAAAAGRLDTLEWLWGRLGGDPAAGVWRIAIGEAAKAGQLAAVEWLLDRGCKGNKNHIELAASGGHVDVVALLWKHVGLDESKHAELAEEAAQSGSLPMLQWVVDHGLPLPATACARAALCGHLDALRFLRGHHCPWNGLTLKWAAHNGHLDILQWALANGCPWTAADRQWCLRDYPPCRSGLRRWIEECWPEEPS